MSRAPLGQRLLRALLRTITDSDDYADSVLGDLLEEDARRSASARSRSRFRLVCSFLGVTLALAAQRIRGARRGRSRIPARSSSPSTREIMSTTLQDLRHALRAVRRAPLPTAIAVLTLGVGIGATSAMFAVVETVLVRALPYDRPHELVMVWPVRADRGPGELSAARAEFLDIRARSRSLATVGAVDHRDLVIGGADTPEEVLGAALSAETFALLGVPADRGRTFAATEDAPGGQAVAVLSQGLWQRRFGADPTAVGATILVDGTAREVVGVMPAGFRLPTDYGAARASELWIPLALDEADPGFRGSKDLDAIVGRLAPGVSAEQASDELAALAASFRAEFPDVYPADRGWSLIAQPPLAAARATMRPTLGLLMSAVSLLLVIAATNVAHLMAGRARERRAEMSIRRALGASRARIVRLFLLESTVLATAAGAVGVFLAGIGLGLARAGLPGGFPRLEEVGVDPMVVGFATAVACAVALGLGLVPAFGLTSAPAAGRSARRGRRHDRGLVIAEIAMTVVLVVAGGLLTRTLLAYQNVDPGFDSPGVATFGLSLPSERYPDPASIRDFYGELIARIETTPEVQAAGAIRRRPLGEPMGSWGMSIETSPGADPMRPDRYPDWQVVTPGTIAALRLRVVEGRVFAREEPDGPFVALVNRAAAVAYWPGESAVGRRVRLDGSDSNPWVTVVGVMDDVRHSALDAEVAPKLYLLHRQFANVTNVTAVPSMYLLARTDGDPESLSPMLQSIVWSLDAELPLTDPRSMDTIVSASLAGSRVVTGLVGTLSVIALLLAASGIYGVMASLVTRRVREIGIRMALGADRARISRMVLGETCLLVAVGLAIGALGALAATRLLSGYLFGVAPTDPVTFGLTAALLASVAVLAGYGPARKATRVDPVTAVRGDLRNGP